MVQLTNNNDTYTLSPSDSLLEALFGDDVIYGATSYITTPTIDLGADRDSFYGQLSGNASEIIITDLDDGSGIYFADLVYAGTGNDTVKSKGSTVSGEVEKIYLEDGNDTLYLTNSGNGYGGNGNDTLIGYMGSQLLSGEDGNDTLIGGGSFDRLEGGKGNDIIKQSQSWDSSKSVGADRILTGWGSDKVYIQTGEGGCAVVQDFNIERDFLVLGRNSAYNSSQWGSKNSGKAVTYQVGKYFASGSVKDGTLIKAFNPATNQYENEAFLIGVTNFSGANF